MATSYKIRLKRFNGVDYDILNISSTGVIMNNGNTLEEEINNMSNNIFPSSNGIIKNNNGTFGIATPGTDYLTPTTSYSPVSFVDADLPNNPYYIVSSDIGKTLYLDWISGNPDRQLVLTSANAALMPIGTEIAIAYVGWAGTVSIVFQGIRGVSPGVRQTDPIAVSPTYKIAEAGNMVAIKKIRDEPAGDIWMITGNVEVVS